VYVNFSTKSPPYYPSNTEEPVQYLAAGRYEIDWMWQGSLATQGLWIVRNYVPRDVTTRCRLFESTYNVSVQYSENIPNVNGFIDFHDQIPSNVTNGYNEIYYPSGARQDPATIEREWSLMNLFAIQEAVSQALSGFVTESGPNGGFSYMNTIQMSDLVIVSPMDFLFVNDFPQLVEDLLMNTTLSPLYFLNNPPISQIAGINASNPCTLTNVDTTVVSYPPQYIYSAEILWEIYAPAIVVSGLAVVAGCYICCTKTV
jgi:hypothetical protein